MLQTEGSPVNFLLLDDSLSLEEDEDVFDDEEPELSSLVLLIPFSSLSLVVFVGNSTAMLRC